MALLVVAGALTFMAYALQSPRDRNNGAPARRCLRLCVWKGCAEQSPASAICAWQGR